MVNETYDNFIASNKDKYNKEKITDIFNELNQDRIDLIKKEIDIEMKHLELINLCANIFQHEGKLYNKTGYSFQIIDPLNEYGIKSFDLAIFNDEKKILIMVDCKSSISSPELKIKEIRESIDITKKNIDKLVIELGSQIKYIEFIYCVSAEDATTLTEIAMKNNIPLCVWSYDAFHSTLKLTRCNDESSEDAIKNGRMHRDEKLAKLLFDGYISPGKNPPIVPMTSTSNIFILLNNTTVFLYTDIFKNEKGDFVFGIEDIKWILKKLFKRPVIVNEEKITFLSEKILEKGFIKQLYEKIENEINNKPYKLVKKLKVTKAEAYIKSNYVSLNARKYANENTVDLFKKRTGFKTINEF